MTRYLLLAGLTVTAWTAAPIIAATAAVAACVVSLVCVLELMDTLHETARKHGS